jgi:hypothetical protein
VRLGKQPGAGCSKIESAGSGMGMTFFSVLGPRTLLLVVSDESVREWAGFLFFMLVYAMMTHSSLITDLSLSH